MESGHGAVDAREARFDELYAEAKATLGYGANTLRSITERYRSSHREALGRWHGDRDELNRLERSPLAERGPLAGEVTEDAAAAEAEESARESHHQSLAASVERRTAEIGAHQTELSKLELAVRNLESVWLFLERGDTSLVADAGSPHLPADLQMRIVEAQESERARIAQEVHDGPAQSLTNAIFQAEYVERLLDQDPRVARTELHLLRELLRRELGDVRSFVSQLRPPLLDELGLDGSIRDTVETMAALTGAEIRADLAGETEQLSETAQTVALRVLQEALQNIRKHAAATRVVVATRSDESAWSLEVRDDGRGFDPAVVADRGRRNFGLQFMRERAEVIKARFEVLSRPGGGTVVRLAIPWERSSDERE